MCVRMAVAGSCEWRSSGWSDGTVTDWEAATKNPAEYFISRCITPRVSACLCPAPVPVPTWSAGLMFSCFVERLSSLFQAGKLRNHRIKGFQCRFAIKIQFVPLPALLLGIASRGVLCQWRQMKVNQPARKADRDETAPGWLSGRYEPGSETRSRISKDKARTCCLNELVMFEVVESLMLTLAADYTMEILTSELDRTQLVLSNSTVLTCSEGSLLTSTYDEDEHCC